MPGVSPEVVAVMDAADHVGLARQRAAYWCKHRAECRRLGYDSVLCETYYGLVCACRGSYDPAKARFSTYAVRAMDNCVRDMLREDRKQGGLTDHHCGTCAWKPARPTRVPLDDSPAPAAADPGDQREWMRFCLNKLPDDQRRLLERFYYEGMTLEQIGRQDGLTREAVRCRKRAVLDALKAIIRDNELEDG